MRNRIILIFTGIVLAVSMVAPAVTLAGARIQDEGKGTVTLRSVCYRPRYLSTSRPDYAPSNGMTN